MDHIQERIFHQLYPRRMNLTEDVIQTIAYNIAFLIMYTAGPDVAPNQVCISIVAVRGPENESIGRKATVSVLDSPGDFTVVISNQVEWNGNVVLGLTTKADKAIVELLEEEGNKGYGDIK